MDNVSKLFAIVEDVLAVGVTTELGKLIPGKTGIIMSTRLGYRVTYFQVTQRD